MTPWFLNEILTGLQKLFTLSLDRTPAADIIPGTAQTWVEALTRGRDWDQARDTPRLREAFATLLANCERWPTPRDLLDALPTSMGQKQLTHDLGIPQTREGRTKRLRDLLGDEFNPATADPNYDPCQAHRSADRRIAESDLATRKPTQTEQHIDHLRGLYGSSPINQHDEE